MSKESDVPEQTPPPSAFAKPRPERILPDERLTSPASPARSGPPAHGPADAPAISLLLETVRCLRAPGGCPWDQEQTHRSLAEHLISEAAELLEAIDNEDFGHIREELGDVLCQVAMHAQIARESGHFDFNDVASEINDKLVRRHPHVFGDEQGQLPDSSAVLQRWEQIKAEEKRRKGIASTAQRLFKDLPPRLPATLFARDVAKQIVKKEMNLPNGVREVVGRDESSLPASRVQGQNGERADCPESDAHQSGEGGETVEESLGRELFALCARAYHHKVDPESALRRYAQQVVAEVEARNG